MTPTEFKKLVVAAENDKEAAKIIADTWEKQPELHCKGYFARDVNGIHCSSGNPKAVSFCLAGALGPINYNRLWHYFQDRHGVNFTVFNDSHTLEYIIKELRRYAAS